MTLLFGHDCLVIMDPPYDTFRYKFNIDRLPMYYAYIFASDVGPRYMYRIRSLILFYILWLGVSFLLQWRLYGVGHEGDGLRIRGGGGLNFGEQVKEALQ